jgi:MSHA biogenesis protein MshJ
MKAQWLRLAARIDVLTLRERVMLFLAAAASILFVAHFFVLGPMYRKQAALQTQIMQQRNNLAGIDTEITRTLEAYALDPDAAPRQRLAAVRAETEQMAGSLRAMQNGLIAPEHMGPLLESILRSNGRPKLVSMRTLPATSLSGEALGLASKGEDQANAGAVAAPAAAPKAAKAPDLLFRHGVEVTVSGSYLDLVGYMHALESMPAQLFWGKAELTVDEYPTSRLTLTLYTLSLDPKWIKL